MSNEVQSTVQRNRFRKKQEKYAKFYNKVNKLLEKYIGGQVFFTELDKAVKFDYDILEDLFDAVYEKFGTENLVIIGSGEIGIAMHNFELPVDILVPGGLRFDSSKCNLEPYRTKLVGKDVVFVDDSYFSGRTLDVIHEAVADVGGHLIGAYVAYDGSKDRDPTVRSLYRYYDHYDIQGRPRNREEE